MPSPDSSPDSRHDTTTDDTGASVAAARRSRLGRFGRTAAGLAVSALLVGSLAACGGDDEDGASSGGSGSGDSSASAGETKTLEIAGTTVETDPDLAAMVPEEVASSGELTAIQYDNAPADTFVEDGEVVGWGPDLGRAVATLLGLEYVPQGSGAFDTFIPGMQNGRFQTTWASLTVLPERLEVVDIVAVHEGSTGVIVKAGSDLDVQEPADLCGLTVAALAGSAFITQLEDLESTCDEAGEPAPEIAAFPQQAAAQLAVINGRADAFATAKGQLSWLLRTEDGFDLEPLDYLPTLEGIGVAKQSGLTEPIAAAIDKLIEDGTYEAILNEWDIDFGFLEAAEVNPTS